MFRLFFLILSETWRILWPWIYFDGLQLLFANQVCRTHVINNGLWKDKCHTYIYNFCFFAFAFLLPRYPKEPAELEGWQCYKSVILIQKLILTFDKFPQIEMKMKSLNRILTIQSKCSKHPTSSFPKMNNTWLLALNCQNSIHKQPFKAKKL